MMTSDLFLGIVSGMIATSLMIMISYFVKMMAIPFLKSVLFDIPNISGQWQTYDAEDQAAVGTATMKQRNRQVEITVIRHTNRHGEKTEHTFLYKGKFASGNLVAAYEHTNMKGYIMGAIVMRLAPDNKTFFGKTVYFDYLQGQVVAHDYWFRR